MFSNLQHFLGTLAFHPSAIYRMSLCPVLSEKECSPLTEVNFFTPVREAAPVLRGKWAVFLTLRFGSWSLLSQTPAHEGKRNLGSTSLRCLLI